MERRNGIAPSLGVKEPVTDQPHVKVYDAGRVAEGEGKDLKGNKENRIGLGG